MKTKTLFSGLLLAFVAASVVFALFKIAPQSTSSHTAQDGPSDANSGGLNAKLTQTQFSAVYFHSPHRCPTCRKIESFAHEALTPEIESGAIAWQIADYTADVNNELVKRFQVFTSTVVLVEVEQGKVVRWKNLDEVWNHTSSQVDFAAFIQREWGQFRATSDVATASTLRSSVESGGNNLVSTEVLPMNVLQFGTMHEAIGQQKSEGRVLIASLIEKPHFFGVGALEKLRGEVTVFDSQATITTLDATGNLKSLDAENVATSQATMLAGAYVDRWSEESITTSLPQKELETKIEQIAEQKGLDLTRPFAFTILGKLDEVTFHVINGACPLHAKIHNKPIPDENQPHHQTRTNIDARLIGIFAKDATGKLTHPGTQVHMHIVYVDQHGREQTGHVEEVTVGNRSIIRLPETGAAR